MNNTNLPCYFANGAVELVKNSEIIKKEKNKICFLAGHMVWGAHELFSDEFNIIYTTLIRNPIDRTISEYWYNKIKFNYKHIKLDEYLAQSSFSYITSHFGGTFEKAINRLSTYSLIGLVEYFDIFIQNFSLIVNVDFKNCMHLNATKKPSHKNLDKIINSIMLQGGGPDFKIYNFVKDKYFRGIRINIRESNLKKRYFNTDNQLDLSNINIKKFKNICLNANQKSIYAAIEKYKDRAIDYIEPKLVQNHETYKAFENIYSFLRKQYFIDKSSVINLQTQALIVFLAKTAHAEINKFKKNLYETLLNDGLVYPFSFYEYIVYLRTINCCNEALSILDNLNKDCRNYKYYKEYISTLFLKNGTDAVKEYIDNHKELIQNTITPVELCKDLSRPTINQQNLINANILIVRSGPMILFYDAVDFVYTKTKKISTLVQEDCIKNLQQHLFQNIFVIPNGRFLPEHNFKHRNILLNTTFDIIMFVISSLKDLESLQNFIHFSRQISSNLYCVYIFENIFIENSSKLLHVLDV